MCPGSGSPGTVPSYPSSSHPECLHGPVHFTGVRGSGMEGQGSCPALIFPVVEVPCVRHDPRLGSRLGTPNPKLSRDADGTTF